MEESAGKKREITEEVEGDERASFFFFLPSTFSSALSRPNRAFARRWHHRSQRNGHESIELDLLLLQRCQLEQMKRNEVAYRGGARIVVVVVVDDRAKTTLLGLRSIAAEGSILLLLQ